MTPKARPTHPGVAVDPRPRSRRLQQVPFWLVVAAVATGLGFAAADRFRVASAVLSLALLLATVLRAVLPERDAGMLVVRSRLVDVLCLAALAVGLTVLTVVVPPPTCLERPGASAAPLRCSDNLR